LLRAARAADDESTAREEARWLAGHRGRAYIEMGLDYLPTVLNVADSTLATLDLAEVSKAMGRDTEATEALQRFLASWPRDQLPPTIARRVDMLAPSKGAGSR